jgi:SAM-dependent methyltransferase
MTKLDQAAFWNGAGGRHWVNQQEAFDAVLAPVTEACLAAAAAQPGEQVIDIGCGCGGTSVALGRQVGASGRVLGIDISQPMLARAAELLPAGLPVAFVEADATDYAFPAGRFDLLFSRFGVMFFTEPVRAFANLRAALKPGGRLVFACFRRPQDNPFWMVPLTSAYAHVPRLPKLGPEDPGPFSFADPARVHRVLSEAGFAAIEMAAADFDLDLGGGAGVEAAVASVLELGPASQALDDQPAEIRAAVAASIREALAVHQRGPAVVLGCGIWLITALAP